MNECVSGGSHFTALGSIGRAAHTIDDTNGVIKNHLEMWLPSLWLHHRSSVALYE